MKTKLKNLSIFTQLIILFLGLVVFVNASLTIIFFFFNRKIVREHVNESIQQKYLSLENNFEYVKSNLLEELGLLSENPVLDDYIMSSEAEKIIYGKKVKNIFLNYIKNNKEYECVCFKDIYGNERIDARKEGRDDEIVSEQENKLFKSLNNMPEGSFYFVGPYKDRAGKILFSIETVKTDRDIGRFGGVVGITYNFSVFINFIKNTKIFGENPIWIFVSGGDILYRPANEKYTFNPSGYIQDEINTNPGVFPVKDGMLAYKDFFLIEDKPLLRVVFAVSSKLIDKGAEKTIGFFTLIFIISVIISFAVVAFISKHFSRPIVELADISKDIARGDFSKRIRIYAAGELNYLIENFNRMTETLQNTTVSRDALVKEVEERKKIEDKLIEYTKKIEDINKELDDFTYIVSHDLKEPLRSINAFAKFVTADYKDKLDEEGRNYLERIQANAVIMQKLIEDLLEISRLERRKNPFEDANTGNMLNEIKIRMEHTLTEKKVEMVISEKMPVVFCDRVRVTEVFANLISNAVKYSDKTHPRVEVGYKDTVAFYEFYVKDNGPGIPEEYHEKIFKIFQRLGKKEEHEGTGVGLTIAKKIVEMHKGRIWVESKVGEGTVFFFTIPKSRDVILGKKKLGEILVEKKIVDGDTIKKVLEEQKKREI
ncbi:MAG: ATP-binding protein [bacterium]